MTRTIVFVLLLCVMCSAPAPAQVRSTPPPGGALDSLLRAADDAGREAADQRGVTRYFLASYSGGAYAGVFGPVALKRGKPAFVLVSTAGVAAALATLARAGRIEDELPPWLQHQLQDQPPIYQESFRRAYLERLSERRIKSSLWGGVIGVAIGVSSIGLLLTLVPD